jgi:L-threonylcarbamoyladenylate synthase
MTAKIEKIDAANPDAKIIQRAARLVAKGEVLVCPTDTGYAFSANALDTRAITKVFHLKGRSYTNPIHIAVVSLAEAERYAQVNDAARLLASHYLPGAVTLVLPRKQTVPAMLVGGLDTVGIRIPDNQVILSLVAATGLPLTTTSANISGKPAPYSVEEILAQMGEDVDNIAMMLDQGMLRTREVSTIVDLSVKPPQLIRQGLVSWLEIREYLKAMPDDASDTDTGPGNS